MQIQYLGWEEISRGGNGNPLQYSCLENPTESGSWRATVHTVTKSQMTEWTQHAGTENKVRAFFEGDFKLRHKCQKASFSVQSGRRVFKENGTIAASSQDRNEYMSEESDESKRV